MLGSKPMLPRPLPSPGGAGGLPVRPSQAGFSLIEVLTGISILLIAVMGFSRALLSTRNSVTEGREMSLAMQAARGVLEELQNTDFADLPACYNDLKEDDPAGASAPGSSFLVSEKGDGVELLASVVLPLGKDGQVYEDLDLPDLGLPRDLNGDGEIDSDPHTDYLVLPVMVRVTWTTDRARSLVLRNILCTR